jgi:glycosyltransferase involved in cell wall biosynthesis
MTDAVVFGSVPFAAPWLTEHNLAWALQRRMPIDWVDPPQSPLTPVRDLLAGRPRGSTTALRVRRPVMLPPISHTAAQRLSRPIVAAQLRGVSGRALAVFARGPASMVDAARAGRSVFLVKDWTPAGAGLLGRSESDLEEEILTMCRRVHAVCAVTESLRDRLRERGVDSRLLRHGFAAEMAPAFDDAEPPPALAALPRPLLGYVGRIDDRLDWQALRSVAERHRDATLALIGPLSARLPRAPLAAMERLPNVKFVGAVDRAALPAHLAALDCCLLPYRRGVWGDHGSPLKLWEYLYAGAPIVGSGYEVLREYGEFVAYVEPGDLPAAVERALDTPDPAGVARRRRFALENTWDHRAAELVSLISQPGSAGPTGG